MNKEACSLGGWVPTITKMKTNLLFSSLGLLLGLSPGATPSVHAETPPLLQARLYIGITVTGTVNHLYAIQATTNLDLTTGWLTLTNVMLPSSPWVFIDYDTLRLPRRFYRAIYVSPPLDLMAPVPAGAFTMGDPLNEGATNELPLHTVYVSAFYMDKYEVTKALWDEVSQWAISHGYEFGGAYWSKAADHPACGVSWSDAVKWCNARSEKETRLPAYYTDAALTQPYRSGQAVPYVNWNAGYRLPTEAEWEKAARGGASGHRFPWSDVDTISHMQANYYSSNNFSYDVSVTRGYHPGFSHGDMPYTSPVWASPTNGFGLHDMAGNVWEWCWDWFSESYYAASPGTDPRGPDASEFPYDGRVLRGGCWGGTWGSCGLPGDCLGYDATYCRAAFRGWSSPNWAPAKAGFRCVLPPGLR